MPIELAPLAVTKTVVCPFRVLLRAAIQHPDMERRGFLARAAGTTGGVVTLVGSSGCVDRIGAGGSPVDERERPDRPNSLTESSVVEYVAEFEAVRAHNVHADAGATDVDLTTAATFDHETDGGYYVTVQHAGTVSHGADGTRSVEEIRSRPTPYRVTDAETTRLAVDRERVDARGLDGDTDTEPDAGDGDTDAGEDESGPQSLGLRLCNVLDRSRELDIEVTRHEGADSVPALLDGRPQLAGTWTVAAREAVELRGIATEPGTYRVVARVSENGLTGEGRIDVELPGVDRSPDVDVISSSNGLSTRLLPAFDPV